MDDPLRTATILAVAGLLALAWPVPAADSAPTDDPHYLEPEPGRNTTIPTVAVIDTGVNPFHETFRRPAWSDFGDLPVPAVDTWSGERPRYVPVDPVDEVSDGAWLRDVVEPHTLYRFAGTNLMYYSFQDGRLDYDRDDGHGTATAGTVTDNAPKALVVAVQTDARHLSHAIRWAADQPWIDVLSISWGCRANLPVCSGSAGPTLDAHRAGKVVVNSAGNEPTAGTTDSSDGPPWVVSVGGADAEAKGEAWIASKTPDVVSDFWVRAPSHRSVDRDRRIAGTSFSAPTVAGTMARTVEHLRNRTGHLGPIEDGALVNTSDARLTDHDVRRALNRTATYWNTTQYDADEDEPLLRVWTGLDDGPGGTFCYRDPVTGETRCDDLGSILCRNAPACPERVDVPGTVPIAAGAPWTQMGWGYVNGSFAPAMADGLLDGSLDDKPLPARAHMAATYEARAAYWTTDLPTLDQLCIPPETGLVEPWVCCEDFPDGECWARAR